MPASVSTFNSISRSKQGIYRTEKGVLELILLAIAGWRSQRRAASPILHAVARNKINHLLYIAERNLDGVVGRNTNFSLKKSRLYNDEFQTVTLIEWKRKKERRDFINLMSIRSYFILKSAEVSLFLALVIIGMISNACRFVYWLREESQEHICLTCIFF
jgi:hypothetical protein